MKLLLALITLAFVSNNNSFSDEQHFVEMNYSSKNELNKIATIIHIDQILDGKAYSVVNLADLKELQKHFKKNIAHSYKYKLPENTIGTIADFPKEDEKYHTYQETISFLENASRNYPQITEKMIIGKSLLGRELIGIKISGVKKLSQDHFIPAILFVGSHHAREHLSTEIPILLIDYLLKNYETNSKVKKLIDTREIYIIPMLNPDGKMYDISGKFYKMWRKNRSFNSDKSRGVDLNRNYSFRWGTGGSSNRPKSSVYMGPKPFSEPETIALKNFIERHPNILTMLSFHTFSELILYPWGSKKEPINNPDHKIFTKMAVEMSKFNKYKPMQASGLYIASGDTCDWAYGVHRIFCFTFELSPKSRWKGGFYPGAKIIDKVFNANLGALLYLIDKTNNPKEVL